MTIDRRTRMDREVRALARDEVFDDVITEALATHGALAARGVTYKGLPGLGLDVEGRGLTLTVRDRDLVAEPGVDHAGIVAELAEDALSDLVQDAQSTMGLAMTARVRLTAGRHRRVDRAGNS